MASTISAGTTTGTAIAIAGDTSGSLVLQTNGTTTAVTIDTSQNVGIGTSSPTTALTLGSGKDLTYLATSFGSWTTKNYQGTYYFNNGTDRVAIDSSGNVGIGTSSPVSKLQVKAATNQNLYIAGANSIANSVVIGGINDAASANIPLEFRYGTTVAFLDSGTEQARIDSAGLFKFNSGYGSAATAYGCRAWVNFNGTGTVAIRASGNVSSITDNGTADYTVNFTTAMPDTNYSVSGNCMANIAPGNNARMMVLYPNTTYSTTFAVGSVRVLAQDYGGGVGADALAMTVVIFR